MSVSEGVNGFLGLERIRARDWLRLRWGRQIVPESMVTGLLAEPTPALNVAKVELREAQLGFSDVPLIISQAGLTTPELVALDRYRRKKFGPTLGEKITELLPVTGRLWDRAMTKLEPRLKSWASGH